MAKQHFDFKKTEDKIKKFWKKERIYKFDSKSKNKIYSIDTPPPTVSGEMHIGHAFSYSQQDFIARFRRMNGENVFYPFGTDDNGLPTERLIERIKKVMRCSYAKAFETNEGHVSVIELGLDEGLTIDCVLEKFNEVTPDRVMEVSNRYLPDRETGKYILYIRDPLKE